MKSLFNSFFGLSARDQLDPITIGGENISLDIEALHFLLAGSTGTGKTSLLTEMLATIVKRGDRLIICDPNGFHLSRFYQNGDTILNPMDRRSDGWSIFNEIRRDYDYDQLAKSVIPTGFGENKQWNHYGQVLLSAVMRALMMRGEATNERLLYWLTIATSAELGQLLAGTPAQNLFDENASRALASTRFIVTSYVNPQKYLKAGEFSLRNWLECESGGNLYITWRQDMQSSLMPLISTWIDILCNAVLSLSEDKRRIWLILDEVGGLGELSSLEDALTRGRKHGLRVVAGLQSTAQLDRIYGRDSAIVLRSCFRNLVVYAVAKSDPETAEFLSRSLGENEVEREQHSRSDGPGGITRGVSLQRSSERIAIPSEITSLPNLNAYLALAGDTPIRRVQISHKQLPVVTSPMEE